MSEQCFFEYVSTHVKLFFDITFDNGFHDLILFVPFDTETSNQMHFRCWFFFDFISEFKAIFYSRIVLILELPLQDGKIVSKWEIRSVCDCCNCVTAAFSEYKNVSRLSDAFNFDQKCLI